jgi:hypothetical protein
VFCPTAILVIMFSPFCARPGQLTLLINVSSLMILSHFSALAAQSIGVAWIPSSDAQVVSYKIYIGMASHCYFNHVAVGNTNAATITGLTDGATYYFAAAAVDGAGNESTYSDEVVFTTAPPTPAILAPRPEPAGEFGFTVSGETDAQYVIQSSSNLIDWVSVQTNTAPFTFACQYAPDVRQCFYRTFSLTP